MIRTMKYFAVSLIATILLGGCSNQSSSSGEIDFQGFPEDEIQRCIDYQMALNNIQLVRIISFEATSDITANMYMDVAWKRDFRSAPETIRAKMPLIFDSRGYIIGSRVEPVKP